MIWSGPLQILAVMALLVRIIHWIPALVGLGVTVALIPLSALVARALAAVRKRIVALTDRRVKLCGEVITGIKAIKLYAWEEPYRERIMALRAKELAEIRKAALIGTWNNMLWIGGPILISMAGKREPEITKKKSRSIFPEINEHLWEICSAAWGFANPGTKGASRLAPSSPTRYPVE